MTEQELREKAFDEAIAAVKERLQFKTPETRNAVIAEILYILKQLRDK